MTVLVTAVLVAAAVGLLLPPRPRPLDRPHAPLKGRLLLGAVVLSPAVLLVGGHGPVLAGVGVAALAGAARLRAARRRAVVAAEAAARVAEFCESVAAELTAGSPAVRALAVAVEEVPALAPVAAASGLGADVPAALRDLADRPGHQDLRVVAAAWQVALRSGGGLADPLERAAATLRERRRTACVVRAELAPARATAQLMAALPVVLLVAGSGLGGHPVRFLTATTPGTVCLVVGLLLSYAGLAWLERIAAAVEGGPP